MSKPNPSPFAQLAVNNIRTQITEHLALVHSVEQDRLLAAHQEAENAFSMGLFFARAGNYKGAIRKAVQALSALNDLQASGRAPQIGGAA